MDKFYQIRPRKEVLELLDKNRVDGGNHGKELIENLTNYPPTSYYAEGVSAVILLEIKKIIDEIPFLPTIIAVNLRDFVLKNISEIVFSEGDTKGSELREVFRRTCRGVI